MDTLNFILIVFLILIVSSVLKNFKLTPAQRFQRYTKWTFIIRIAALLFMTWLLFEFHGTFPPMAVFIVLTNWIYFIKDSFGYYNFTKSTDI